MPSAPGIYAVEPFSSTAVVRFREPESLGGVPVIKYRVEWRSPGKKWTSKEHDAEEGESFISLPLSDLDKVSRPTALIQEET